MGAGNKQIGDKEMFSQCHGWLCDGGAPLCLHSCSGKDLVESTARASKSLFHRARMLVGRKSARGQDVAYDGNARPGERYYGQAGAEFDGRLAGVLQCAMYVQLRAGIDYDLAKCSGLFLRHGGYDSIPDAVQPTCYV